MRYFWGTVSTLYFLTCGSTVFAQDDIRDDLRVAIDQSIALPDASQYVTFGPLLDNRTIKLRIRFHSEGGYPSVRKDKAAGGYLIDFPRQGLATAPFIEDAMLGCLSESRICSLMTDYLLHLRKIAQPGKMLFFDEVYPDYSQAFRELRQEAFWGKAVSAGLESAVLVVDTHEMCHVSLEHLDGRAHLPPIQMEGEADGCMLYFFEITNLSPVGGLAYLIDAAFGEEVLGEFTTQHPSPRCRSMALADASLSWLEANRRLLEESGIGALPAGKNDLRNNLKEQAGTSSVDCGEYNKAVSEGKHLAETLFNESTGLTSDP